MAATNKQYSYPRVAAIQINVHLAGENSTNTPHTFHARSTYGPRLYVSHIVHVLQWRYSARWSLEQRQSPMCSIWGGGGAGKRLTACGGGGLFKGVGDAGWKGIRGQGGLAGGHMEEGMGRGPGAAVEWRVLTPIKRSDRIPTAVGASGQRAARAVWPFKQGALCANVWAWGYIAPV
jgi:hypothetical protein